MSTAEYCLYVVQLLPVIDPGRIKIGRSMRLEDRLYSYQSIVPEAKYVAVWWGPTPRSRERDAITLVSNISNVQRLGSELFRVKSVEQVIEALVINFGLVDPNLISLLSRNNYKGTI